MHKSWQACAILAALLLALTYFLVESRAPDLNLCARLQSVLQSFELHHAELTRDALLLRAGLLANYDSLTHTSRAWSEDLATLRRVGSSGSREAVRAFQAEIDTLGMLVARQQTLVEYFKSDNALLRNSLMYFDSAGQDLRSRLERDSALAREAGALSHSMLRFTLSAEPTAAAAIEALLHRQSRLPALQHDLRDLTVHARLIAQVLPQVDTQLHEIVTAAGAARGRALHQAVLRHAEKVESRAQVFRVLLYCAALALTGYLIYLFVRLRSANEALRQKIAERERLQEANRQQELQLIQANKMSALGTLVSGVAHEINNPNQLILSNCRVLTQGWADAVKVLDTTHGDHEELTLAGLAYSEMRELIAALIRDVHDAAQRIGRIVDELKDFSRPRVGAAPNAFQLNDAVQRALRLLAHLVKQRTAKLHVDLAPALPALRGHAQQIEQVVVNLLTNALEALPRRECAVAVSTYLDDREHAVILEVRDEGIGIAPEDMQRLCDPFFTTKQASGGTGLGLAITSSLVRAHGGRLAFDSEPGKGTCVQIKFQRLHENLPQWVEATA